MSQPLSHDLRVRVLNAYLESQDSYEVVAERFGVSIRFIRDLVKLYKETGSVEPRPHGGGAPQRLSAEDMDALKRWVTAHPDWYAREFKQRLETERGVNVSLSTVERALKRLDFTLKKRASTRQSNEPSEFGPNDASSKS